MGRMKMTMMKMVRRKRRRTPTSTPKRPKSSKSANNSRKTTKKKTQTTKATLKEKRLIQGTDSKKFCFALPFNLGAVVRGCTDRITPFYEILNGSRSSQPNVMYSVLNSTRTWTLCSSLEKQFEIL